MGLGVAIFSRLSTDAGVKALAGSRIYPGPSPDNIYPMVSYDVEEEPDDNLTKAKTQTYTVELTCVSLNYATTSALAAAVLNSIDRQTWTAGGYVVQSALKQSANESTYTDSGNAELTYYLYEITFSILAGDAS